MKNCLGLVIGLLLITSCATRPVIPPPPMPPGAGSAFPRIINPPPQLKLPEPASRKQWIVLNYASTADSFTVYQKNRLADAAWTSATNVTSNTVALPLDTSVVSRFFKVVPDMPKVTLSWYPSMSTNVTGYVIYYGGASRSYTNRIDCGNTTIQTIALKKGVTYYFAATAYTGLNVESDYSTEVSYTPPTDSDFSLPARVAVSPGIPSVTNLTATNVVSTTAQVGGQVVDDGGAAPVTFFLWGTQNPTVTTNADWQSITVVGTNAPSPAWITLTNLIPATTYYYSFSALNASGQAEARPVFSFTTLP